MSAVFLLVTLLAECSQGISGYVTVAPDAVPPTTQAAESRQEILDMGQPTGITPSKLGVTIGHLTATPRTDVTSRSEAPAEGDPLGLGIIGYEATPFDGTSGEAGYHISVPGMPSFAIALPNGAQGYQLIENVPSLATTTPSSLDGSRATGISGTGFLGVVNAPGVSGSRDGKNDGYFLSPKGYFNMGRMPYSQIEPALDSLATNRAIGRPDPPFGVAPKPPSIVGVAPSPPKGSGVAPDPPKRFGIIPNPPGVAPNALPPNGVAPNPPMSVVSANSGTNSASTGGQSLWDQINNSAMDFKSFYPLAVMADIIEPIVPDPPSYNTFPPMGRFSAGRMSLNPMGKMNYELPGFNSGMISSQGISGMSMQNMMKMMQAGQSFPQVSQGPSQYEKLFGAVTRSQSPMNSLSQAGSASPQLPHFSRTNDFMSAMMKSALGTVDLPTPTNRSPTARPQLPAFRLSPLSSRQNTRDMFSNLMPNAAEKRSYSAGTSNPRRDYSPRYAPPSPPRGMTRSNEHLAYASSNRFGSPQLIPNRNSAVSASSKTMNLLYSQARRRESPQMSPERQNTMTKRQNFPNPMAKRTSPGNLPSTRNVFTAARRPLLTAQSATSVAQSIARNAALSSRSRYQRPQKNFSPQMRRFPPSRTPSSGQVNRQVDRSFRRSNKNGSSLDLKRLGINNGLKSMPYRSQGRKLSQSFSRKPSSTKMPVHGGIGPMAMMLLSGGMGEMEINI